MRKADNFNSSKWLVENKITTQSRLNEDLTDEIAALPNHHTAEDTEEATLVVGKYAVVRYDESDEGGENMYVVWDNTVNQDEIGSYDDEPEFESTDPAEVAAFLKKNESLNENFEETHEYLEISPENFQPGDYFLRTPVYDNSGEFFDHKEKIKILSIDLPKDGRSNISKVKTEDGEIMELSSTSLYDIARPL